MITLWKAVLDRFLLLPLGVVMALVWANTRPDSYFRLAYDAAFPVNEIGMAVFLGLIAQELFEALMPGGVLRSWRHMMLPVVGAAGGFAGSVGMFLLYIGMSHELMLGAAWPVVAAIDLAAGYYVVRLIYPHRGGAMALFLMTAVITDAAAIIVTSVRTGLTIHPGGIALLLGALAAAVVLRRRRVTSLWPYVLGCGAASWIALYWLGFHPALALVPIVPLMPHAARSGDPFADRDNANPLSIAEHRWNVAAQVAVFLFGFVNAGVIVRQVDTGTWAVIVAALVGRPAGMLGATALAVAAGLHLPKRLGWSDLVILSLATTSGLTFALFLTATTLPVGAVAQQIALGALATSSGALVTVGAAWLLSAGRFASPRRAHRAGLPQERSASSGGTGTR